MKNKIEVVQYEEGDKIIPKKSSILDYGWFDYFTGMIVGHAVVAMKLFNGPYTWDEWIVSSIAMVTGILFMMIIKYMKREK